MTVFLALMLAAATPETPGMDVKETRIAMSTVASCIVSKQHDQVATIILSDKDSDKMRSEFIHLASKSDCPKHWHNAGAFIVMMLGGNFHFAVAEALVAADLKLPIASLAGAPVVPHATFNPAAYQPRPGRKYSAEQLRSLERETNRARANAELSKFGDCIVRSDTANSQQLLLSKVETAAESLAFASLKPAMSKCLLAGQTASLDKSLLRGAIGFSFYRLANAPRVAGAAE